MYLNFLHATWGACAMDLPSLVYDYINIFSEWKFTLRELQGVSQFSLLNYSRKGKSETTSNIILLYDTIIRNILRFNFAM